MGEGGDRGRTIRQENEFSPRRLATLTLGSKSPADGPSSSWLSRHFPWYQLEEEAEQPQTLAISSLFPTTACGHVHTPAQTSRTGKRASAITIGYALLTATLLILLVLANQLYSPHTTLQSAHLSRQRFLGFNRDSQRLDRTTARLLRDRHHRSSYGPPTVLRSHGHYSAHVSRTHRPARRTGNRSIEFSFSHAFNSISRTISVLTRYSSSTPFSFRKENYVTLQQENDGAFPRSLLTLPNVHPASSSGTRQHFDGHRAVASIPINRTRISAVIASALSTHRQVEPDVVLTETNPTLMHSEKDTAMLLLKGAHGRTPTLPTHRHVEPDVSHADASSTPPHEGRDTAVLLPKGAHYGTPTLRITVNDTYKMAPAETNPTPLSQTSPPDSPRSMRRERNTAMLLLKGAHGRIPTLPTFRQVEPDVVHTDANPTPPHEGRDTAGLLLKGAHCRTPTLPTRRQVEPVLPTDSLSDAQVLALAPALTTAPATSTALSPTRAAADGKP